MTFILLIGILYFVIGIWFYHKRIRSTEMTIYCLTMIIDDLSSSRNDDIRGRFAWAEQYISGAKRWDSISRWELSQKILQSIFNRADTESSIIRERTKFKSAISEKTWEELTNKRSNFFWYAATTNILSVIKSLIFLLIWEIRRLLTMLRPNVNKGNLRLATLVPKLGYAWAVVFLLR